MTAAGLQAPFAGGPAAPLRAVLMSPPSEALAQLAPTHGEPHAIAERAREQFALFCARLRTFGVTVSEPATPLESALAVFAADLAVVFPAGAFLMRPSDPARRRDVPALEAALAAANVPIVGRIESPGVLDGGDVLLGAEALYLGVATPRAASVGIPVFAHGNAHGREQLAAYARSLDWTAVEVPFAAEATRLRSVAAFVANDTVLTSSLLDPAAFAGLRVVEMPQGEAYAAGVLALGERRVIANTRFRLALPMLKAAKIAVDAIDLWEFGKVGATPGAMVLALKRG